MTQASTEKWQLQQHKHTPPSKRTHTLLTPSRHLTTTRVSNKQSSSPPSPRQRPVPYVHVLNQCTRMHRPTQYNRNAAEEVYPKPAPAHLTPPIPPATAHTHDKSISCHMRPRTTDQFEVREYLPGQPLTQSTHTGEPPCRAWTQTRLHSTSSMQPCCLLPFWPIRAANQRPPKLREPATRSLVPNLCPVISVGRCPVIRSWALSVIPQGPHKPQVSSATSPAQAQATYPCANAAQSTHVVCSCTAKPAQDAWGECRKLVTKRDMSMPAVSTVLRVSTLQQEHAKDQPPTTPKTLLLSCARSASPCAALCCARHALSRPIGVWAMSCTVAPHQQQERQSQMQPVQGPIRPHLARDRPS